MQFCIRNISTFILLLLSLFVFGLSSCKTSQKTRKILEAEPADENFYTLYAKKLGVSLSGKENKKLIKNISNWLGTPYKYGGCDKKGTDCSCFVKSIINEVYNYNLHRRSEDMILDVIRVNKNQLNDGDLVFFKINGNKISHVGVYINQNKFVHASKKRGVVINDLDEPYYKKYFYTGGRLKQ